MKSIDSGSTGIKLNGILLALLLVTMVLIWAMKADPAQRNVEFLPGMYYSVPYDGYDPNPNFPDGKTLREPPAGTVPKGDLPLRYSASPEDALRAGAALVNPFTSADAKAMLRGTDVYLTYCIPCHGAGGLGDGLVPQRGFPRPPSLLGDRALQMKDGQMFHIVTYGQANMPSHAAQVPREDRWKAILYVRSLQQTGKPAPAATAPAVTAQAGPATPPAPSPAEKASATGGGK